MPVRKKRSPMKIADDLFGQLVRARGRCENCGTTESIQCAHGFSRRYKTTRWNQDNAFALCKGCHFYFTVRPLDWDDWLLHKWGLKKYTSMRRAAQTVVKTDYQSLIAVMRSQLNELAA